MARLIATLGPVPLALAACEPYPTPSQPVPVPVPDEVMCSLPRRGAKVAMQARQSGVPREQALADAWELVREAEREGEHSAYVLAASGLAAFQSELTVLAYAQPVQPTEELKAWAVASFANEQERACLRDARPDAGS